MLELPSYFNALTVSYEREVIYSWVSPQEKLKYVLSLYDRKLSRTVLRRESGSNGRDLSGAKQRQENMSRILGIDLGTTNSVMAVMEGGKPTIIPNAEGERLTPSIVAFTKDGEKLVGQAAKRQAITNPEDTVFSIKRFAGRKFDDPAIQQDMRFAPCKIRAAKDGNILVWMGAKFYSPSEILAIILQKLKRDAEEYLGEPVTDAVITAPAYFSNPQRQSIKDAANIAGINVIRIINEPTAACLAYGLHEDKERIIAVYHLGGGTLDISILETGYGVFEVKSTNGDTHLGGDDFDQRIIDWICEKFKEEQGVDLRQDKMALQRLKEAAENAKCELSSVMQTDINLPYIIADTSGPKNLLMTLHRAELEELVSDLIEKTLVTCNHAIADIGGLNCLSDIDEVVLVGQQTRMPAVQEAVRKFFGKYPCRKVNPAEVVALGAAVQGGVLSWVVKDVVLLDITPFSLGIETLGGVMTRLIEKNATIPSEMTEIYSTTEDNQTSVIIHVLQGEKDMAKDNISLGRFVLSGILSASRGIPQIKVTFDIDRNGILNVSAEDKDTGRKVKVTIDGTVHKMVIDGNLKVSRHANEMINRAKQSLSKHDKYLSTSVKSIVDSKVSSLLTDLQGGSVDDILDKTQELEMVMKSIEGIGKFCDEKSVEPLVELLKKEENKQVRENIRNALQQIGGTEVDEALKPRTIAEKILHRRHWVDK